MVRRLASLALCLGLAACNPTSVGIGAFDVAPSDDAASAADTAVDAAVEDAAQTPDAPSVDASVPGDVVVADVPVVDALPVDASSADGPDPTDAPPVTDAPVPPDVVPPDGSVACRSSRECSTLSLVCDPVRMLCVECVSDLDCPTTQLCGTDAICRPPRCTAGPSECASETRVRTCDPRTGFVEMTCPAGSACAAGRCQARACTPNAVECGTGAQRRVCNSDGSAWTTTACPAASHAVPRCAAGVCSTTCDAGFADCNGVASDGCEVDLRTDATNCGVCRTACAAGLSCNAGSCGCSGAATTTCAGRCVDVRTDAANCGACGMACPGGTACSSGSCGCGGGLTTCGGRCVNVQTDLANCGGCGLACATSGSSTASIACLAGACAMTCNGSNYDVDRSTANGCEVADDTLAGHTQATASPRAAQGCSDTTVETISGGRIVSDARTHVPAPAGFSATAGAAPDWYSVRATSGTFCANNYGITITTSGGSSSGTCYQVTFITDVTTVSMTVSGSGGNTMSSGAFGLYTSGATLYFRVEKICSLPVQENVTYSLSYHL